MEIVAALAAGAVSKIVEMMVKPVVAQIGYLTEYDKNIKDMKENLKALERRKQEVKDMVDAEERSGHEIASGVESWLHEVDGIVKELQKFCEDEEVSKNKNCLGGWCPHLNSRYSLSKRAKMDMPRVLSLKEKNFVTISRPARRLKWVDVLPTYIKSFESRKTKITEVVENLKNEKLKRISICGMGGVGKTTMAYEVIKIVEAEKLFDAILLVSVSQTPDYRKIQSELADQLELKLERESLEGRANQLLSKIKKKTRVLVVLDDVWAELEFERIGIPSNDEHHKFCKILFTSRNEQVCRQMGSETIITISILSEEEAWNLFQEKASSNVVNKPGIRSIAKEIVKECRGLPIAIVTVGKALLGETEKYAWEAALDKIKKSSAPTEVEKCIELSYNLLEKEEAIYLLLCCLFPEDYDIPVEVLMRHAWGIGLCQEKIALWRVRNQVHSLLNKLKRRFLLLNSNIQECVKMHDVVRDAIISIAARKDDSFKICYDAENKEGAWNCSNAVSLMIDDVKERANSECSKLELLQVASKDRKLIPENFFESMRKLKVLGLQNLHIPKMQSCFQGVVDSLRTLRLEDCQVGDISIIGKELRKLEILSFARSNIKELPNEIGQLGFLKLLDLTRYDDLDKISSNVLSRLSRLEELYFEVRNFPWKQNTTIIYEMKSLSQLNVLEIRVPKIEFLLEDLEFKNLVRFWLYVGLERRDYFNVERDRFLHSKILQLRGVDDKSIKCRQLIKRLIKNCDILVLEKVMYLKNVVCQLDEEGLPKLKDLQVQYCTNLECIVDSRASSNAFALIQSLSLNNLDNLIEICHGPIFPDVNNTMVCFSNLVELNLGDLPRLVGFSKEIHVDERHQPISQVDQHEVGTSGLFSYDWMQRLPKLEEINLFSCGSLKTVFDLQKLDGQGTALLPQLINIYIDSLPELTHVWGNVPHSVQGFHNLRSLHIQSCDSLRYVFTAVIVKALPQLEELDIQFCDSIEKLVVGCEDDIDDDGIKEKTETIVFVKLHSIDIYCLPNLVSFGADCCELVWPSLRKLVITDCDNLKDAFKNIMPTQTHTEQDNLITVGPSNPRFHDAGITNSEQDSQSLFKQFCLGCTPTPKLKRSTNKVTTPKDHVTSVSGMENKAEIRSHIPILEDLSIESCDKLDVLFPLEEHCPTSIPLPLKRLRLRLLRNLEAIVGVREERSDINFFAQLESLYLNNLPNLETFCGTPHTPELSSLDKQEDKVPHHHGDPRQRTLVPLLNGFLFPNLTSLYVSSCDKISSLFSLSSSTSLERLEKLEISWCRNMEEIVASKEEETQACGNKIEFRRLQVLRLHYLPKLKAFCRGTHHLDFPSMLEMKVIDCPNVEMLSPAPSHTPKLEDVTMEIDSKMLSPASSHTPELEDVTMEIDSKYRSNYYEQRGRDQLNATIRGYKAFIALRTSKAETITWSKLNEATLSYFIKESAMTVKGFPKLLRIVPFNEIHMFQHLKELRISICDSLLEVFEPRGVDAEGDYDYDLPSWDDTKVMAGDQQNEVILNQDKISFPKLQQLYLGDLPNLQCFCSKPYHFDLPSCVDITITSCPKMTTFTRGSVSTPKLHRVNITSHPVRTMGPRDLNLATYYSLNSETYKVELQKLETFRSIEQDEDLLGYITRVTRLELAGCKELLHCVPSNMMHRFQHLEELLVEDCGSIEEIFETEAVSENENEGNNMIMQYNLKFLALYSLPKLKHIWNRQHSRVLSFQNLKEISASSCHDLKYLLPASVVRSLSQLEKLRAEECEMMEEIVTNLEDDNMCGGDRTPIDQAKIVLPKLRELLLETLPSLKCLCSGNSHFELPSCRNISIKNCAEVETLCFNSEITPKLYTLELDFLPKLKHMWNRENNNDEVVGFQDLQTLKVRSCHNLTSVLPVSVARSLSELEVSDCEMMEEIIALTSATIEESSENENKIIISSQQTKEAKIILPALHILQLEKLPSLNCFFQGSCDLELPNCSEIHITGCSKMKTFCNGPLYTPQLDSFFVDNANFWQTEDVNGILQQQNKTEDKNDSVGADNVDIDIPWLEDGNEK